MNKAGKGQEEIAEAIGFSQGTVSKELRRNRGLRGYRPGQARKKADERKEAKRSRPRLITGMLEEEVDRRLGCKHSPEQISGALRLEGASVSHETIYSHIMRDKAEGGTLYKSLRINGRRRCRRRAKAGRVGKITGRAGIEERPKVVDARSRYGDWEVDLIEGSKGSGFLLSLYGRKSRLGKLVYLPDKGSEGTAKAIVETLEGYKVKTITYDNGLEFSRHVEISRALGAGGYFCTPYHSWEKGGVENFNGLVRQYFPKGSSFEEITPEEVQRVEDEINQRPRKTLGFRSPSDNEHKLVA